MNRHVYVPVPSGKNFELVGSELAAIISACLSRQGGYVDFNILVLPQFMMLIF